MFRIVISGFYGFDNAGDEAILHSMITELRRAFLDIEIIVLSADPSKTSQNHNVKAANRSNIFEVWSQLWKCDLLISGGGSLFQDVTSNYSMWYYSAIILLALLFKKPVVAFAQGIGPIKKDYNRKLLRFILNRMESISVRDARSGAEMESIGVKKEIYCTIDPAFLIECNEDPNNQNSETEEIEGCEESKPSIGFSLRSWKSNVNITDIFAEVADRAVRELGVNVVFFPLHYKKDLKLAEEVAQKMQEKAVIIRKPHNLAKLIKLYGQMDLNVSIRFHGLVFSIINNKPIAAVSYDPKIDSLMEWMGMPDILYYDHLTADQVYEFISKKWINREMLSDLIVSRSKEYRKTAHQGVERLLQSVQLIKNRNS